MEAKYLSASPFRQSYERDRVVSRCAGLMLIEFIQEDSERVVS